MLTKLEIQSLLGETLSLEMDSTNNGYIVESIEGLDPVKANIVTSRGAKQHGSVYQTSHRENRNVVIRIRLEAVQGAASVSDRRAYLYGFFMPMSDVSLRFFLDGLHFADIQGYVESFEAPIFSKEPTATISLICVKPDLVSPTLVTVNGVSVSDSTVQAVVYTGTVEAGFKFQLFVDRTISEFSFHNHTPYGELATLDFAAPLIAGDVVEINTVSGSRGAYLTRASVRSSILNGVSPTASWFGLSRGTNMLRLAISGAAIPFSLEYYPRYGGL